MWRQLCGFGQQALAFQEPHGEGHPKGRRARLGFTPAPSWYGLDSGLQGLRVLLTGLSAFGIEGSDSGTGSAGGGLGAIQVSGPWGCHLSLWVHRSASRGPSASWYPCMSTTGPTLGPG